MSTTTKVQIDTKTFIRFWLVIIGFIIAGYLLYKASFGLSIIFSALFFYVGSHLNKIYSYFADFDKKVVYSTSLVTLKGKEEVNLSKLKGAKIGISNDGDTQNLSQALIDKYSLDKNNEMINFESNIEMILKLYNNELDYIFLPTNFADIYGTQEEFEDIGENYEDNFSERMSKEGNIDIKNSNYFKEPWNLRNKIKKEE